MNIARTRRVVYTPIDAFFLPVFSTVGINFINNDSKINQRNPKEMGCRS
jgi:hypothetical protein